MLADLVQLGIVERREAPPSALFRIVPEHVAARAVCSLSRARDQVLAEMGRLAAAVEPTPVSVIVFGSLARGEAEATSDIDVVVVRPAAVDEGDERWNAALDDWRRAVGRLSGNRVDIVQVGEDDVGARLRGRRPLWQDVARHGIAVFGATLARLQGARRG